MTQIKKLQQINSNWEYKGKYGYIVDQDTGETICQQSDEKRGKLIASSPDLLKELQWEVDFLEGLLNDGLEISSTHSNTINSRIEILKQAINKATK